MKLTREKLVVAGAILLASAQIVAALVMPQSYALTTFSDLLQTVLLVLGTGMMYANALRARGRTRYFWGLITLGFCLWTASQLIWSYYDVLARREVPTPSFQDVIVFLRPVPMMGALALQMQSAQDERSLQLGSLDVVLILFWWLYLCLFLITPWGYLVVDQARYNHSFATLALVEQLLLVASLGILWWKTKDGWRRVYRNFFAVSLFHGFGFYAADLAIAQHRYYTGSAYDIPLVASMAAFVWVGVVGSRVESPDEPAARKLIPNAWAARLAMAAVLSMPLLALSQEFGTAVPAGVRHFRVLVSLGAIFLMGCLVLLRQHLLTDQLATLLERSEQSLQDLRRLQTQLVQSEKLASLGQLVSGAAHEINNPLTAILGFSEMLVLERNLSPTQEEFVEKIRRQAQRTKELVASLLDFARQTPGQKTALDVNALLQTAIKLSQTRMQRREVRSELDLGLRLPSISGDKNQLLQVLLHLVRNAVDAMEAQGSGVLRVVTRLEGDDVVIEVSDSGIGLKEPERVFDPFYTTKSIGRGTGLGLSSCYGIVREHGGTITCYNRPEGGATFQVRLPAGSAERKSPTVIPPATGINSGG